eukprot:14520-Rhodomonas_salina.3
MAATCSGAAAGSDRGASASAPEPVSSPHPRSTSLNAHPTRRRCRRALSSACAPCLVSARLRP